MTSNDLETLDLDQLELVSCLFVVMQCTATKRVVMERIAVGLLVGNSLVTRDCNNNLGIFDAMFNVILCAQKNRNQNFKIRSTYFETHETTCIELTLCPYL
jgi:hypothetical protein